MLDNGTVGISLDTYWQITPSESIPILLQDLELVDNVGFKAMPATRSDALKDFVRRGYDMGPFQSNQKPIGGYNMNRIDAKKGRARRLLVFEKKQIRPGLQLLRFDRL